MTMDASFMAGAFRHIQKKKDMPQKLLAAGPTKSAVHTKISNINIKPFNKCRCFCLLHWNFCTDFKEVSNHFMRQELGLWSFLRHLGLNLAVDGSEIWLTS